MSSELETMTDQEVFDLEAEVTTEAIKRRKLAEFRDQARRMAEEAKQMGSTQEAVETLVGEVVSDVFAPESESQSEPDAEA